MPVSDPKGRASASPVAGEIRPSGTVGLRRRFRAAVRVTHLWVGLVFSLLLLVLSLSGSLLVFHDDWLRARVPGLEPLEEPLPPEALARGIARADRLFGDQLRTVKMPGASLGAFHLYLMEGQAFLDARALSVVDRWRAPEERVMAWIFDLHAHLLAGETGERIGGVVALLGLFLVVSGLVLWWPARRRTRLGSVIPGRLDRPALVAAHRDLGVFSAPVALLLLATGAGIVFYGAAGVLLNGLFGDPARAPEPPAPAVTVPVTGPPGAGLIHRVREAYPGAELVFYYPPGPGEALHRFRLRQPCELHPNGRTFVQADGSGAVVSAVDACALPPGERALHAIYPLHSARVSSRLYRAAVFLGGLALAGLSLSGAWSYGVQLRRGRPGGQAVEGP